MHFSPLTMADFARFKAGEARVPLTASDTNFTNLFIWRRYYNFVWAEIEGGLGLIAAPDGQPSFAFPPVGAADPVRAAAALFEELARCGQPPVMRRVPEAIANTLAAGLPGLKLEHDRDSDDYLYLSSQLISLSGRKMHQKKNHYNHFVNNYKFECLPVDKQLRPCLEKVMETWLETKEGDMANQQVLHHEMASLHELFDHLDDLPVQGMAIRIDGRIEAFTFGEHLNQNTAVIHVEKANQSFRGLFVALGTLFCRQYYSDLMYINREQDLGLEGLRQSKESLKPDHMVAKFNVFA